MKNRLSFPVMISMVLISNSALSSIGFAASSNDAPEIEVWGVPSDAGPRDEEKTLELQRADKSRPNVVLREPNPQHEIQFISETDFLARKENKSKIRKRQAEAIGLSTASFASMTGVSAAAGAAAGGASIIVIGGMSGFTAAPVVVAGLIYGGYKLYKHTRTHHILLTSDERRFLTEISTQKGDDPQKTIHLVVDRILDNFCVGIGFSGGASDLNVTKEKTITLSSFLRKEKHLIAYDSEGGVQKYPYFKGYPHILVNKAVICRRDASALSNKESQSQKTNEYMTLLTQRVENEKDPDEAVTRKEFDELKASRSLNPETR